ncbi:MAG: SRPBCC family protein [Actinomycetota bacterium]|nr:SRPBCC family protein [Actinomycetota bacterium]MDQ3721380.1 SRPBCC family protein [Actinomycetota bacterium]
MAEYSFLTTWLIEAERERAWEVLQDVVRWPEWWRGVVSVDELQPGSEDGVGSRHAIEWRSRLPYPVRFEFVTDRVERPALMQGRAEGELAGTGRWWLFEQDGVTAVLYEWVVRTRRPWMNALAPMARPVFAANHDIVMRWGGEGLARRLGAQLLAHG